MLIEGKQEVAKRITMKNNYLMSLPEDIFLIVLLKIRIRDLFALQTVSHSINHTINTIQSKQKKFWEQKARLSYTDKRLEGVMDFKELLLTLDDFKQIIQKDLEENSSAYFIKSLRFTFFELNGDAYTIGNAYWDKSFSLMEMSHYLVEDKAEKLFGALTSFNELAASLGQDYLSIEDIRSVIGTSIKRIETLKMISIQIEELYFIALLPFIIKARAVDCFEIVIRAYFYLAIYFSKKELAECELLTPFALMELVFKTKEAYFKQKLATIVLLVVPTQSSLLSEVLNYYHENGEIELIKKALLSIDTHKARAINGLLKTQNMHSLREALFPSSQFDKLTTELISLFTIGEVYLRNNAEIKANVIESIQQELNLAFDKLGVYLQEEENGILCENKK